jgi:hypothetical protein
MIVELLAVGSMLRAGAAAARDSADAVEEAARRVDTYAADAGHVAGHAHVRDGLDDFASFHNAVLHLLALAVEAVSQEMVGFDECMATTDATLAAGC